jgi:hypothetical protein
MPKLIRKKWMENPRKTAATIIDNNDNLIDISLPYFVYIINTTIARSPVIKKIHARVQIGIEGTLNPPT